MKHDLLEKDKGNRKKNFVYAGYRISLFIDNDTGRPVAAEARPK